MLRSIIDTENFIEEIRRRPILYDGQKSATPDTRRSCWEEVTKITFKDVWDRAEGHGKDALVKEVQLKWKSLRDTYNRIRKLEKEAAGKGPQKPRKKYIYYDLLSFLDKGGGGGGSNGGGRVDGVGISASSSPTTTIYLQEDDDNSQFFFASELENSNPLQPDEETKGPATITSEPRATTTTVTATTKAIDKMTDLIGQLVQIQKDDKNDDRMGNKRFLLSLLPFLQKLPDDVNLEVRLQLMSVIQTYSSGESFMKM